MTKLQSYMIAGILVFVIGCSSQLQTTVHPESVNFTPPGFQGTVQTHDSTVYHYVDMPVLRDSVVPHDVIIIRDSMVVHRMPFTIIIDSLITPRGDTLIHTTDTFTKKATWKGWQKAYAIQYLDTATIAPPPSTKPSLFQVIEGYLAWIGVFMMGAIAGVIGWPFLKSMIKA